MGGSPVVNTWAGAAYFYAGRVEDGMACMQRALELDSQLLRMPSIVLARAYLKQGMDQQAIAEIQKGSAFNDRNRLF